MTWATGLESSGQGDNDANLYPTRTSDQRYADQANFEAQRLGTLEALKNSPWVIVWCLYAMWCIVLANFMSMAGSSVIGIPQFRKDFGREYNGNFVLEGSWQSALDGVPRATIAFGTLGAAWIADSIGRRNTLFIGFVVSYVGVTLEVIATTIEVFFVGRLLVGLGIGACNSISLCYVAEIAPVSLRGIMMTVCAFGFPLGSFASSVTLTWTADNDTRWAYRAASCTKYGFLGTATIFIFFMPESPWWLIERGCEAAAANALRKLGVAPGDLPKRIAVMRFTLARVREETSDVTYMECFRLSNLRRTMISIAPVAFQALTGTTFVNAYFTYYAQLAGYRTKESFLIQVVQQGLCMVGNVFSWFLVDHVGRRSLTLWGLAGTLITHFISGGLGTRSETSFIKGVIAMQLIFVWIYNVTIGSTGVTLLAEVSTPRLRAKTVAIGMFVLNILTMTISFVVPFIFNPDKANLGAKTMFIFGGLVLFASVVVWAYVPETAGRSFEELDEMFIKRVPARNFKSYRTRAESRALGV